MWWFISNRRFFLLCILLTLNDFPFALGLSKTLQKSENIMTIG